MWTPAARAAARLVLVADEEPGSMQHFTTALLLGDVLARLHAAFAVSVLAEFDEPVSRRLSYTLVRTSGGGEWVTAIRECERRLSEHSLPSGLHEIVVWPVRPPSDRVERAALAEVAEPLSDLASRLQLTPGRPITKKSQRGLLFDLLIQVRNKTFHGAYDARFYEDHVSVVDAAVSWLSDATPLWKVDPICVTRVGNGRILRGAAPTRARRLPRRYDRDRIVLSLERTTWEAVPLMHVRGDDVYLANGSWRDTDTSAEFLCHALVAQEPGQGSLRCQLPDLARPPVPGVGQVVDGHYRIVEVLGSGEDAVVYLASDTNEDAKYVLKAFREPKDAFDQRRMEFAALQQIRHPGVPRVLEIQSWEDPFHLRFEYVAGAPLEATRDQFSGNLPAVLSLSKALLETLAAVHSAGYVHRDVAPENILIPEDPDDHILLFDFDVVAPIGTIGSAGTSPSFYRPPEAELEVAWTGASDLYSVAVVLIELLTGRLPEAISGEGSGQRVPSNSAIDTPEFAKVLAVLNRAASHRPESRFETAAEFWAALETAAG